MLSFNKIGLLVIVLLLSLASLTACTSTIATSSGVSSVTPTADVTSKPFKIGADGKLPPELAALGRVFTVNNKVKSYKLEASAGGSVTSVVTVVRPDRIAIEPTSNDGTFAFKRLIAIGDTLYTLDNKSGQWLTETNNATARQLTSSNAQFSTPTTLANSTITILQDEDFEGQKVGVFQIENEITLPGQNATPTTGRYESITRYDKTSLLYRQSVITPSQGAKTTNRFYNQDSPTNVVEPPI